MYALQPTLRPSVARPTLLLLALALLLSMLPVGQLPGAAASVLTPPAVAAPAVDLASLPLSFIPNAGQSDPAVRFQAHALGGAVSFTPDAVVLALPAEDGGRTTEDGKGTTVVRVGFEGANQAPEISGAERLQGVANVYLGNDPATWRSNLPTYGAVVYQQLYPGIDLRYDGAGGRLKGTYTVAPSANPTLIRWRYEGASTIRVDQATGNLLVTVPASGRTVSEPSTSNPSALSPLGRSLQPSTLTEQAPVAWQEIDGQRVPVTVRYELSADTIGFALGTYNPAHPLTIDPTLVYSTYLGGTGYDLANAIAVDGAGNAYVTGQTNSTNFPGAGRGSGTPDVFVAKLNPAGDAIVYSTYLGGNESDEGYTIAVDGDGNVWVAGDTSSGDFPTSGNAYQDELAGDSDAFVAKLDATGTRLYSTFLGGEGSLDEARGVAVDGDGNAYVAGVLDPGAEQQDVLLAKFRPTGQVAYFIDALGGSGDDLGWDVAVDGAGNAYVTGETSSEDFPTTAGVVQRACGGEISCNDAFVAKLSADGTDLLYSTYLGGDVVDAGRGIVVDGAGNAYVVGQTNSTNWPGPSPIQDCGGRIPDWCSYDAFVLGLNPTARTLRFATYLGGEDWEAGTGIALDGTGDVYVTGWTDSIDFPVVDAVQPELVRGICGEEFCDDAFVTRLEGDGSALVYSTYLGGSQDDYGMGIAVDRHGNAYVAGETGSTDFNTTPDSLQPTPPDPSTNAFVAKIGGGGGPGPGPGDGFNLFLPMLRRR